MNTRQNKYRDHAERGKLADLFATALTFIRQGKRDEHQCARLFEALQRFKENTLVGVIGVHNWTDNEFQRANLRRALELFGEGRLGLVSELHLDPTKEDLQRLLSKPISEVFDWRTRDYFANRGATYIGELYIVDNDSRHNHWRNSNAQSARTCRQTLIALGLPLELDLDEVGWVPPYAEDPRVLEAWSELRAHDIRNEGGWYHDVCFITHDLKLEGCQSAGEHYRYYSKHGYYSYVSSRSNYHPAALEKWNLKPVMYVPVAWMPPVRDPEGCRMYGCSYWDDILIPVELKERLMSAGFSSLEGLVEDHARFKVIQILAPPTLLEPKIDPTNELWTKKILTAVAERGLTFRTPSGW